MDRETAEFGEISIHLRTIEQKVEEDQYPAKAQDLLAEMATDTDMFARRLCLTNSKDNVYAQIPILLWVRPEEFVARFMALPQEQRRNALIAFAQRYTYLNVAPRLAQELDWVEDVKTRLEAEIAKLPPISRYALTGTLKRYVELPLAAARLGAAALASAAPNAQCPSGSDMDVAGRIAMIGQGNPAIEDRIGQDRVFQIVPRHGRIELDVAVLPADLSQPGAVEHQIGTVAIGVDEA
jgi:hypothetical protein